MKFNLKKTILLAILLRLIILPFFYHPDIKSQYFHFQFLSQGQLNIYRFLADHKSQLPYRDTFNYLPLTYFSFGSYQALISPILPHDYFTWLNDWSARQNEYANLPYFLFFLKLPYLFFDICLGLILLKLTKSTTIFRLWLFNPISLYLIYVLGNFDILPVFLTIYSYYLLTKHSRLAFFVLGLAISLKLYPLLLLPFFLLPFLRDYKKLFVNLIFVAIPLVITLVPFASDPSFLSSFLGSGLTQKILASQIFHLPLFPLLYLSIFIYSLTSPFFHQMPKYIFYLFLLFISLVNFHPQWLLWFLPFIFLLKNLRSLYLPLTFVFIFVFLYIFLFQDQYLFWGHLVAVDPQFVYVTAPSDIIRFRFLRDPAIFQHYLKSLILIFTPIIVFLYEKNHPRS